DLVGGRAPEPDHRGNRPHRRAGRRAPRPRAQGALPAARQCQSDGVLHRQRGVRPSREGRRPLRRRRQRDPRHRHRARLKLRKPIMDAAAVSLPVLVGLVVIALAFDFLNGFHDAANSVATIVSTRVLRPHYAVSWAAFFNFIAFLVFGLHVAQTLGTGIVEAEIVDARVVFGALTGAIVWNLITWFFGIPSSSSHALIGGLLGAGLAKAGIGIVVWAGCRRPRPRLCSPRCLASFWRFCWCSGCPGCSSGVRRSRWISGSGSFSSSPPRSIPSGTAATTPRKPWGSSPSCSIRRACSDASSTCRFG